MPDHAGRRRRQARVPTGRLVAIAVALVVIARLATLPAPVRDFVASDTTPAPTSAPAGWTGPAPVDVPGTLSDGDSYTPRLFLTTDTSVGVAVSPDGTVSRLVLLGPGGAQTELRRLSGANYVRFDGFVADGNTLLWMESVSAGTGVGVSLWRTDWTTGARPTLVTSATGEANFFGGQFDVVVADGRAYWVALGSDGSTDVRSVAETGGQVTQKSVPGTWQLSSWPWAVSIGGGRGTPVTLLNLATDDQVSVPTAPGELTTCGPTWCRVVVLDGSVISHIDLEHLDGSLRQRIAGPEATPILADPTLLDRFVPLATDTPGGGVGLSVYDVATSRLDEVAGLANTIQGAAGVVWWSTGLGSGLTWHALDLRSLP